MLSKFKYIQFLKINTLKTKHFYCCVLCFLYLISTTFTFAQIDSLEQLLLTLPANEEKVEILNELSYLSHREDIQKTFSYASEALELARKLDYTNGKAHALLYLSIAHSISGDSELSKEFNNTTIHLADSLEAYILLMKAYNVKAFLLMKEGKPEEAIAIYQLALDIAKREDDKKGYSSIKLNMAEIHAKNGDYKIARNHYKKAIEMAKENGNTHVVTWGYGLMADTYVQEKNYVKATTYLEKAIKDAEQSKDIRTVSYAKSRLAKVYLETGKIESAQQQSLAAIDLIKKVGDKDVLAEEYIHLICIYLKGNLPNKAISTSKKGLNLTDEINSIQQKIKIQELLARSYAAINDYQKAYEYNTLTQSIKDSLDLSAKKKLTAELEEKYQSKKKEAENAILRTEQHHQAHVIAQQKSINFFLIIVAFLSALLGYFAFKAYRNKQRNNLLLEEKVAARTLELQKTNTQLVQSNEELSRFAYAASHDLREPLRNITNFTQLLQKELQSTPKKEVLQFMDIIHKNTAQMNNLIIDTLAFTKLSNNAIKKTAVNINDTIKNIKSSIADTLKKRQAIIDIRQPLPTVYANEGLLFSVFKNLIENGITYNESGAPVICINYTARGQAYIFSINDNGIGIPKEYQETIFKMFKRLQNKEKYEGTGMGLANCKKIINKLGGKIWVESDGTNGATFFFTLPMVEKKKVAGFNEAETEGKIAISV